MAVSSPVSGRRTQPRRNISRFLCGLSHEEQASAASPALSSASLELPSLLTVLFLSQMVNREIHSQGSLGLACVLVTLLQSRSIQHRAYAQQSLRKSHPHLKRKFAAWLHHGFSWFLFSDNSLRYLEICSENPALL